MTSVIARNAAFTAHTKPTTGDIKSSFVAHDHLGWLICDGRELSTVTFNLLFQVIGYTYGVGQLADTFRLPNMTGRVIGSAGTIVEPSGTYPFPSGTVTGEVEHLLLLAEIPRHNHDDSTAPVVPGIPPADGNTSTATTGIVINPNTTGITTAPHSHSSNAVGGQGNPGLCIADGSNTVVDTDPSQGELNVWTTARELTINNTTVTINDPTHAHTITDAGHRHTISSNGNSEYHNNMQPTIFYGNTFVYCGIPTAVNWTTSWPYPVPQTNPPLL
jgi:microcystin-dependent protein